MFILQSVVSDIFAFPTIYDIWELVVSEALSYGVPVITTNMCGAGNDLVKDDYNGFIINEEDVEELHNKIMYILENESIKKRMSMNAFNDMKNFTIETEVEEHLEIFLKNGDIRDESINNNSNIQKT